jgi:CRISPR-associated protein Cas2
MSARRRTIVSYDIADPKRWRTIYRLVRGHGDRLQYSVFRCDITDQERAELIARLHPLLDHEKDQVMFIDLGPASSAGAACIETVGRTLTPLSRGPVII